MDKEEIEINNIKDILKENLRIINEPSEEKDEELDGSLFSEEEVNIERLDLRSTELGNKILKIPRNILHREIRHWIIQPLQKKQTAFNRKTVENVEMINQKTHYLEEGLDGTTNKINSLEEGLDGTTNKINSLEEGLDGTTNKINSLEEGLDGTTNKINSLEEGLDGTTNKINSLEEGLDGTTNKINSLEEGLDGTTNKINSLEEGLDGTTNKINSLEEGLDGTTNKINSLEEGLDGTTNKINSLEEGLDGTTNKINSLEEGLDGTTNKINSLEEGLDGTTNKINSLEEGLDGTTNKINSLEEGLDGTTNKINSLEEGLDGTTNKINSLEEGLDGTTNKINSLEEGLDGTTNKINSLEEGLDGTTNKINSLEEGLEGTIEDVFKTNFKALHENTEIENTVKRKFLEILKRYPIKKDLDYFVKEIKTNKINLIDFEKKLSNTIEYKNRKLLEHSCIYTKYGTKMYLDKSDSVVSKDLAIYQEWEPNETKILQNIIKENMNVVDIGAHIGYYTILFSKWVGKKGKVFSFEPETDNFQLLKKNINANKANNVIALQKAISNQNEPKNLFLAEENKGDHQIIDLGENRTQTKIECVKLDLTIVSEYKIDVIKMDIQGAEMLAIEGMDKILDNNSKMTILLEFWPYGIKKSGFEPKNLFDKLEEKGFKVFLIDEELIPVSSNFDLFTNYSKTKFVNFLCKKE